MLQQLRRASKSWVASVIIGFLVLAFALWGVADIFRGGTDTVVAQVGGTQISSAEYDLLLKNQIRTLSQQTKQDITMDQAKAIGLDRSVLDQAIGRAALGEESQSLGLTASQNAIANEIRSNNAFRGADGAFDPNAFARTLQDNGLSEAQFVQSTGEDITRSQLLDAATAGITAPPGLTRLLYDFITEQRVVEYLAITPEEAGKVPEPTQADLEAYYKAHGKDFSAPEYRALDYVAIGPDQVADQIQVSDADIQAQYDSSKAQYDKPEQRDIEQIAFPDKAAADAAYQKIKSGTDFLALAKERGLKDTDIKLGTFTQAQMDPKLATAAFAVPEGGVTQPVQGPFGWVLLRAAKVTPGENKTFDEVKDQIKADLIKARAAGKVTDLANAFEDARGGGATLEEAAKKIGVPVTHIAAVDAQGMTPEGSKADLPDPQILQTAFQTESGEESDLFQTQDGRNFAVRVTGITPPAVKPLDSVREEVKEGYLKEASAKLLQTKVQQIAQQAMKDGNLAAAGKALGHAPVTSMPIRRSDMNDVFSPELVHQLFAVPKGGVVTGAAGKGDAMIVARVVTVSHSEPDVRSAEYINFRRSAAQQLGETVIDSLASATREKAGVEIHQATVDQVLGGAPQQ
jgi:peptidyl-prolyl cis-trans isomerase D